MKTLCQIFTPRIRTPCKLCLDHMNCFDLSHLVLYPVAGSLQIFRFYHCRCFILSQSDSIRFKKNQIKPLTEFLRTSSQSSSQYSSSEMIQQSVFQHFHREFTPATSSLDLLRLSMQDYLTPEFVFSKQMDNELKYKKSYYLRRATPCVKVFFSSCSRSDTNPVFLNFGCSLIPLEGVINLNI